MHRRCLTAAPVLLMVIALAAGPLGAADTPGRAIDPDLHHLGNDNVPEWKSLTSVKPEGREIDLGFTAKANDTQHTLRLDQQDVDEEWQVKLNERTLGTLKRDKAMRTLHLAIPPGTLADGDNRLTIRSRRSHDDIIVGRFHLFDQTLARVLRLGEIRLHVTDLGTGKPVPARVTLTDEAGRLVELHSASGAETAIRPGVVYTLGGGALVALPEGRYTAYATRGTEWSLDRREVTVRLGQTATARFSLRREVDTRGFVAADTHIHTLTHSGHGDASIEERMITLAGEGVELAVATDHDHNIDYRPVQQKMKLTKHFTPVVGNEVSTPMGHFNAFPLDPKQAVPNQKQRDWVKLVDDIRSKGARVIILNHPRWPEPKKAPLHVHGLDRETGERATGQAFTFDAMELVNSTDKKTAPLNILRDWLALLNHGETIVAVGSSDSHTVGDPVGQGRTYVRSSTDDPARIDIDQACAAFRRGDVSVSMGIFAEAWAQGDVGMGRIAPATTGKPVRVRLRIASAGWIRPTRAMVLLNGRRVAEKTLSTATDKPTDRVVEWELPAPSHDAHLVCAVVGEAVTIPAWPTLQNYTFAATNPIFLDADGDGSYTPPRKTAERELKTITTIPQLQQALKSVDAAVGLQMLSLWQQRLSADTKRIKELAAPLRSVLPGSIDTPAP